MIFCTSWDRNGLKQNLCQFVPKLCHHTSRQRELMEMDDHRWNWRFIRNWKYCPSESITDKNQYRFYVRQEWVKRQRFQAFYPFWQTAYLIPFDKQFIWSLLTNSLFDPFWQTFYLIPFDKQLKSPEQLFLTTLTPSHKDMKETPRKRPREPPNSATREVQG